MRATDVVPIALATRFPGTEIGSGDIDSVLMTAGSSGAPQFFHAKPRSPFSFGRSLERKVHEHWVKRLAMHNKNTRLRWSLMADNRSNAVCKRHWLTAGSSYNN